MSTRKSTNKQAEKPQSQDKPSAEERKREIMALSAKLTDEPAEIATLMSLITFTLDDEGPEATANLIDETLQAECSIALKEILRGLKSLLTEGEQGKAMAKLMIGVVRLKTWQRTADHAQAFQSYLDSYQLKRVSPDDDTSTDEALKARAEQMCEVFVWLHENYLKDEAQETLRAMWTLIRPGEQAAQEGGEANE